MQAIMNKLYIVVRLTAAVVLCLGLQVTKGVSQEASERTHQYAGETTSTKCIPDEVRQQIKRQIAINRRALIKSGKLKPAASRQPPMFIWPLQQAQGFDDPGYYAISNYLDQDPTSGTLDYNCGTRTYNGHNGTDVRIVPFRWNKMANDEVEIIAAAAGTIILKQDGNFDMSCAWGSGIPWNAVFVEHADGTVTWYGHMKNGSTTPKDSGDVVAAGEYLGIVGSSGNSTGAHLHFEVYDPLGNLVDPFQGPCNSLNNDTWWLNQLPYYDSGINRLITATQQWTSPPCPQQAQIFEQDVFDAGEQIVFSVHYRHDLNTDSTQVRAVEPDGDVSTILDLTYQRAGAFHSTNPAALWTRNIPANPEIGKWTFEADYYTTTYGLLSYEQEFWVTGDCAVNYIFLFPHTVDRYYEASNTISSTATIVGDTHIVYDAENVTTLSPGFHAPQGCKLEIKTNGCQ